MTLKKYVNTGFILMSVAMLAAGGLFYRQQENRIEQRASAHLTTMLMLRESVLRSYLESLRSEVILWSSQRNVINIFLKLNAEYRRGGEASVDSIGKTSVSTLKGDPQGSENDSLDERVTQFAAHHHYYDTFFISSLGDILYTVAKEHDLGTNLVTGPFAESGLGRLFRALVETDGNDEIVFEDFSSYAPSNGEPAAFIGSPVYSDEELIGYYAVQIPATPIDRIMQFSAGMGETGETYLVGRDGLMRSNSRFFEESSILETEVSGATVDLALDGEVGISIVDDYRGVPVFSAHRPFDFEGTRWAVLAEQDVTEVFAPAGKSLRWIAMGYAGAIVVGALLRFMLIHVAPPAALGAFLGYSILDSLDDS